MSMFFDRIMRQESLPDDDRRTLGMCTVLDINNVARYYYEGSSQEVWNIRKDFPNIAPPLPAMFFEYQMPTLINSEKFGINRPSERYEAVRGFGVGMWAQDMDPSITYNFDGMVVSGMRWLVETMHFMDVGKHIDVRPLLHIGYPVTEDGMWYSADDGTTIVHSFHGFQSTRDWAEANGLPYQDVLRGLGEECMAQMNPILLALSFMHCKNVIQRAVKPEDWIVRNAQKKKRPIPVTYHVLDIEPMKTVLRTEGQSEKTGLKKALHICRGHFAAYDEKPLFGKVRGTFWKPSHVRGSLSEGAVVKDYRVLEPKQFQKGSVE